ncbi:MAG: hypothetical protein IJP20_01545 [Clostridia bacterium]|nr:hypothetical protein [Clostridia bacterium]
MRVIAKKKKGVAWIYGILSALGLLAFLISLGEEEPLFTVFGILICTLGLVIFAQNVRMPDEIISVNEETGQIYLHPEDVSVFAASVSDISYRKGRLRSGSFKWGTIIIETPNESYSFNYVADCEVVAKELTRIMYLHKNK